MPLDPVLLHHLRLLPTVLPEGTLSYSGQVGAQPQTNYIVMHAVQPRRVTVCALAGRVPRWERMPASTPL